MRDRNLIQYRDDRLGIYSLMLSRRVEAQWVERKLRIIPVCWKVVRKYTVCTESIERLYIRVGGICLAAQNHPHTTSSSMRLQKCPGHSNVARSRGGCKGNAGLISRGICPQRNHLEFYQKLAIAMHHSPPAFNVHTRPSHTHRIWYSSNAIPFAIFLISAFFKNCSRAKLLVCYNHQRLASP
jgi:hypothetical protein